MNKQLRQTELRLQNDIHEYKYKKLTMSEFITEVSDIIKDEYSQTFKIIVTISKKYFLTKFNFCILFNNDYPFKPPKIILMNEEKHRFPCDQFGFLEMKFLSDDQWSPCLSLKVIIYALELLIYDPNDTDYSSIQLLDNENKAVTKSKELIQTQPKIITISDVKMQDSNKIRKRKHCDLENHEQIDMMFPIKKFKLMRITEIDKISMSIDN